MDCEIANKNKKNTGFSLIELSVVLIIIGILIYMTLVATTAQLEAAKVKATQDKLTKIQNALYVYYSINNALPCPAEGDLSQITSSSFGKQVTANVKNSTISDATCNTSNAGSPPPPYVLSDIASTVYIGVVPTRDLGLSDDTMMDGWGDRITYIVSKNCIDPDNWASTNTYKCQAPGGTTADGDQIYMIGKNAQYWSGSSTIPTAAYIAISFGKDQFGAWNRAGTRIITSTAPNTPDPAELINANWSGFFGGASLNGNTYYDKPINDGDATGVYYDDITIWNTAAQVDYNANH